MDSTKWQDDLVQTPRGSVVLPNMADIYLHYVMDLWFDRKWRPRQACGEAVIVRYADDLVVGFEHGEDAERFQSDLEPRLKRLGLALHPDKARCIEFGRHAMANHGERGERRPATSDLLGFMHFCQTTRKGQFDLERKPQSTRMKGMLKRIGQARRRRSFDISADVAIWLRSVIDGRLQYFAVPTSFPFLSIFVHRIKRLWFQQLWQCSRRVKALELWLLLDRLADEHLPAVRILHPWRDTRFTAVHTRGRSPMR